MLSDEEKEAIEILKKVKNEKPFVFWFAGECYNKKSIFDTVLNLIEKQSKEIEELKNGQIDFWISDKEIEERIRNKFVSKDKIKAEIEELKNMKVDGETFRTATNFAIKVLQSLLEKE